MHGRLLPVPCCGKRACQVHLDRQTSPGLRFSHLLAGPKVSSQSISCPRYLNSASSHAAPVASAQERQQALSNLERELVRAGSTRANTEGVPLPYWGCEREHSGWASPGLVMGKRQQCVFGGAAGGAGCA